MLIKNGLLVTEASEERLDLRIEGGVVGELAPSLSPAPGEEVIDAAGLLVLPGGVDVHTHMCLDLGHVTATDDFYTGTVAAACGGTTTIVDHMGFGPKGCSIAHQVEHYHRLAGGNAVIDYGFHGVTDRVDEGILSELESLVDAGITSHKFYLTYGGKLEDRQILPLMERAAQLGVLLCVHPENDALVTHLREKFLREGKLTPDYHPRSRPVEAEAEAIGRMLLLARAVGDAPLYIVHLTNGLGLSFIERARRRGQRNLYAETCPQYLTLDDSLYSRPDGLKYIMSPPLRSPKHAAALWGGIASGSVDTVATDHCPFFYQKEKQLGAQDFTKAPGGAPGVEARMALLFSEGVTKGCISLGRFVSLTAANPAKLFGMYPKKGTLQVGSDGDAVLIDPGKKVTIRRELFHENTDYTPYEGMEVTGWPVLTVSRGEVVAKDGRFTGAKGRGRFVKRGLPQLYDTAANCEK